MGSKPKLTIVIGLPGVGKSTVARLLAKKTGAVILNTDVTRRELFPNERTYSPEETQAVIEETERRVKGFLKQEKSVMLVALFTKKEPRDHYKKLAESMGVDFKIILVTADEEVIKKRMDAREQKGDPSEANFAYYLDRKPHFVPVQGEYIVIDNSGNTETLNAQLDKITTSLHT